jgi:drug/metabolite transporter (DMT)-like permease
MTLAFAAAFFGERPDAATWAFAAAVVAVVAVQRATAVARALPPIGARP